MALHPEAQKLLDSLGTDISVLTMLSLNEGASKPATLTVEGDRILLDSPYYPASMADIKAVPGRTYDPATKRWSFPAEQFQTVYQLTMLHFPNTKVPVLRLAGALGSVIKAKHAAKAAGAKAVTFEKFGKGWLIHSPYDPMFVDGIKNIPGRKWVGDMKAWSFPKDMLSAVVKLAKDCYGANAVAEPIA